MANDQQNQGGQGRYQQYPIDDAVTTGQVIGEVDSRPWTLEEQAEADRAAGAPTWGTRGFADTGAFARETD